MREIKIGLLWHSADSGNLGVGALTVGNIAIVSEVAARLELTPRFTIFSVFDRGANYISGTDVYSLTARTMLNPAGFAAAVGRQDCVLDIGAGDSFADIYALKRYWWIVVTKVVTISKRVPLIFSPQTIGPFDGSSRAKRALNRLAFWSMRRARAVVVRDDRSRDAVHAAVPGIEPVYSVDVAFALPWTTPPATPGRPRIGLNVSGLLWHRGSIGRDDFNLGYDYRTLTTRLIETLLASSEATIELICHVNGYDGSEEDDGVAADELAARFPALVRVPDFTSPSAAKSYISGLDAFVGARMHACIAAFSSGVPVIPVSYSRKFEGLFGSLGYRRLVPCTGMPTEAALALIVTALGERALLKDEVAAALTQVTPRLDAYRAVLHTLFDQIDAARRTNW